MSRFLRILIVAGVAGGAVWLMSRSCECCEQEVGDEASLVGNPRSSVVHNRGCRVFEHEQGAPIFASREEAIAAGYRPCGVCRP